ncbi:MAG: tetratricopeptide repeat protein [Lentisphaerae bacterium]|nr:tetratricopeptide repeat protein [Lentisphaerota bacterium]MBT5608946.1 tetratricopeptide repeat protein [Lentisphaerota bacterium]MBT7061485.1 tetratricopeptide repeat protein [Lentisphaerota bacterium]MBT7845035.1 tetratricopeptide repeat protein [Lentisphaerota bacterium]
MSSSPKQLLDRVREHRGTLRVLSLEALHQLSICQCGDPRLKDRIIAETMIRAWLLSGGGAWTESTMETRIGEAWHNAGITEEACGRFSSWLNRQQHERSYRLPDSCEDVLPDQIVRCFVNDMDNWRTAHGMIVFIANGVDLELAGAVPLPFVIDDTTSQHEALVRTASDLPLPGLDRGVQRANSLAREMAWIRDDRTPAIWLTTLDGSCDVNLVGESAGLPVLTAHYLRSRDIELPPLSLGLSGTLKRNGTLDPMAVVPEQIREKARLLSEIGVATAILPDCNEPTAGVTFWPVGVALDSKFQDLAGILRPTTEQGDDLGREKELRNIENGMRYGSLPAKQAQDSVVKIVQAAKGRQDVRGRHCWAWAMINLAAAQCHLGKTTEASDTCQQLLASRHELGMRFTLRALVREAINLHDMADYRGAVDILDEAESLLPQLSEPVERTDLEMQIVGTRGQTYTFWAMIAPNKTDFAFQDIRRACQRARELDAGATLQKELPRDLCYQYQATALLRPRKANAVYQEARDMCDADAGSRDHFRRVRWLAAYRLLLTGFEPPDWSTFEFDLPDRKSEGGWVSRVALKYRGALRADAGDEPGAISDFREATELLELHDSNPLLAFIGATAALQAGESLRLHDEKAAIDFLRQAESVLEARQDWFSGELVGKRWLERAQGLLAGNTPKGLPNPQLLYPY